MKVGCSESYYSLNRVNRTVSALSLVPLILLVVFAIIGLTASSTGYCSAYVQIGSAFHASCLGVGVGLTLLNISWIVYMIKKEPNKSEATSNKELDSFKVGLEEWVSELTERPRTRACQTNE